MKKHEASCSCGQLTLIYEGEIVRTSVCHCFACQKRTGSVFGFQTRFDRSKTMFKGESTIYKRTGDEGSEMNFHFCPKCGTTVYWEAQWLQGAIAVALGTLCDPTLAAPIMQIYGNRKHHWVTMPEAAVEYFE